MSTREFLTNVTFILTIMAVGASLEIAAPFFAARRDRRRQAANLSLTVVSFLSNWLLASIAAILALTMRPHGMMATLSWPFGVQVAVGILILDFSVGYLSHRTLHMSAFLWRFHRIHHSDDFVDVTTTYRTHPVETVWRFLFAVVPVWMAGIPAQAVVIQRLLQAAWGVMEHSNVRLWRPLDRLLSLVFVTPNVHKVHHSRALAETNSNYGNVLTLYDRLLRTFAPSERAYAVVYGLDDVDPAESATFSGLLMMPFDMADKVPLPPDAKVRNGSTVAR
jgi:sterol desaturase/sphingolipid hydroxylase (fatty acid hydroxylase superfamily)